MEAWRAWLRRQKVVSLKYNKVYLFCKKGLTRVSSGRRKKRGPELFGKKERACKRRKTS
jgi:hypothetical protein